MSASVSVPILNITIPWDEVSTPYIFLPPDAVYEINLNVYFHVAALGILLWDFLNNLRNDFRVLTVHKFGIPTFMYFVVRLTMVAYCLGRAALLTLPIGHCGRLSLALNVLLIINVIFETALCYLRIVAVYTKNRCVKVFFGLTWLSVSSMALTFWKTFGAVNIGPTQYCRETIQGVFAIPTLIVLFINDLTIYLAIAYRIYKIFMDHEFGADFKRKCVIILFGASLPIGSKIVLLESQLYCLIIVLSKAFVLGTIASNEEKNAKFLIFHLVLVTILVSRVYRELNELAATPRRPNPDFQTGNLTSHEFANGINMSVQERVSKKTMELHDDASSIGESIAHTNSMSDTVAKTTLTQPARSHRKDDVERYSYDVDP